MKANELSAKDLMVGDWVCNLKGDILQIQTINESYVILNNDGYYYNEIQPIPLTLKILKKNGFKEYDGLYRLDIAEGVFVNADFKSKEPFVSIHNTCYRAIPICRYVHQIQNALRLCGINHEIIL